jgi:hypothetical protein
MRRRRTFLWALPLFIACETWSQTGRLVNEPCLHVGVRPASDSVGDGVITVQVTTDWPFRCYPTDPDAGR